MKQRLNPTVLDIGVDQLTKDKVFLGEVVLELGNGVKRNVYVVWNETVGIVKGMYFVAQGSADHYFVSITASLVQRAKNFAPVHALFAEDMIKFLESEEGLSCH
jgi:hypothetical protein